MSDKEKRTESHTIDFDYQELLKANIGEQVDVVGKMVSSGLMNQDEGRAIFNYNPLPDGHGQRFFVLNTLVPVEQVGQPAAGSTNGAIVPQNDPQTEDPGTRKTPPDGLKRVVADVTGRMVRRLATHAEKATRSDLGAWLADGIQGHRGTIAEAFGHVVALCRDLGYDVPAAERVADSLMARFVANPTARTAAEVQTFCDHITGVLFQG